MKLLLALALLLVPLAAEAQQVPNPINAPASIMSGDCYVATSNPQQAADGGTCGGGGGGQTGVTPQSLGAKCDGTTDDSAALQTWLNEGASGTVLSLTKATCLFKTPLSSTNPQGLTIIGAGPYQSILKYAGTSTTSDIIALGALDPGTQTSDMYLSNFRVTSSTQMTAGAGIHFKNIHQVNLLNVTPDGQGGSGDLWKGIWFDQVDDVVYLGVQAYAQNDAIAVDGDSASGGAKADLWLYFGKIQGSGTGIHVGGAFGGLYVDAIDIIGNADNLLIDTALVSQANREIFIGCNTTLDSATQDNIQVNDTLTNGATLKLCGWNASATRYGLNVISWPSSIIDIVGGPIFNNGSDGIFVGDRTSWINVSIGVHINANGGYGVNAGGAFAIYADPSSFTDTSSPNVSGPYNATYISLSNGILGWKFSPNLVVVNGTITTPSGDDLVLSPASGEYVKFPYAASAGATCAQFDSAGELQSTGSGCGPGSAGMSLTATDQTFSGGVNLTAHSIGTVSSGTTTVDCGQNPIQYLTNNGAFTLAAPSNDGECTVKVTNGSSAGAITFSGFSEGTNTGDPLNTTNGAKFFIVISRIDGDSHYLISALQ